MNLTKINSIFSNSGMLINVLANILILLIGIYEIMNENMTIGELLSLGPILGYF